MSHPDLPPATDGPSGLSPGTTPAADPAPNTTYLVVREESRTSAPFAVAIAIVAVLAGSALFVSGYSMGRQTATTPGTPVGQQDAFQPFWDAYYAVRDRYAGGEVDTKTLVEGAIKGMIGALEDPYSSYLTSEEYRDSLRGISGEFEGIGAEIGTRAPDGTTSSCSTLGPDCRLVIVSPLEGSPAQKAGLEPGDVILAVDGDVLDGLSVDAARDRIRGPKGTEVVLSIERGTSRRDVAVLRDVIIQREVIEEDLAGGRVGYIRLTGFSEHAADTFAEEVAEDVDAGRRALILDLRGNPGGFVTAARDIASQFLASGTIFWQEDGAGNLTETTAAPGGAATDPAIELVVLVDGGSASASEIVAGALRDRDRATLVGERTFGKGTVQQWTPLEDDHGGFRLTVAKWLTPDRTWIHGSGITPDVVVREPADAGDPDGDPALDRALEELGFDPEAEG